MSENLNIEKLDKNMRADDEMEEQLTWHDPGSSPFRLSGFAWFTQEKLYRRLPVQPGVPITEAVDRLANCTAGGQIDFQTNATTLAIQVTLRGKANMRHMPATGQCGFDCYIGGPNEQRFYSVTKYNHTLKQYTATLLNRKKNEPLSITLNFPLYQGVESVFIGTNQGAEVRPPIAYDCSKKVIFYGTSITQGGCASRPGMAYSNILSRRFNMEFINLGFSGNGRGEANMARIIAEIEDPACLVLDYEGNCTDVELYKETLPRFIQIYREAHRKVPILVVSRMAYPTELLPEFDQRNSDRLVRLAFQKNLVDQLREAGDQHLHFLDGTHLLGDHGWEGTVDGSHPNDLGFMNMADNLTPVLREILGR